ncbi:unnamed protein product [Victoria cruziana]
MNISSKPFQAVVFIFHLLAQKSRLSAATSTKCSSTFLPVMLFKQRERQPELQEFYTPVWCIMPYEEGARNIIFSDGSLEFSCLFICFLKLASVARTSAILVFPVLGSVNVQRGFPLLVLCEIDLDGEAFSKTYCFM